MNLFDINTPYASPNKAINDDGDIITANGYSVYKVPLKVNTTYTFQKKTTAATYIRIVLMNSNDEKESLAVSANISTIGIYTKTFTTTSATAYAYIQIKTTDENVILVEGTNVGGYSPYNMGCITEKIVNKNLFDKNNFNYVNGKRFNDNGEVVNDADSSYSTTLFKVQPSTTYTIQGTQSVGGKTTRIYYYDNNKTFLNRSSGYQTDSYSFTTPSNCYYIALQLRNSTYIDLDIIQLEQGSTATTYVAHQEQTYTIPCQQPMRSIGTVRDCFVRVSGVWYERHNIVNIIMNGTETITVFSSSSTRTVFQVVTNYSFYGIKQNEESGRCTHFRPIWQGATWQPGDISTRAGSDGTSRSLFPTMQANMTIEQFKTWLGSNNVITDMKAVTPVDLPCTTAQTQALEAIYKAKSYEDVTHVFSEDGVPIYFVAKALKK